MTREIKAMNTKVRRKTHQTQGALAVVTIVWLSTVAYYLGNVYGSMYWF